MPAPTPLLNAYGDAFSSRNFSREDYLYGGDDDLSDANFSDFNAFRYGDHHFGGDFGNYDDDFDFEGGKGRWWWSSIGAWQNGSNLAASSMLVILVVCILGQFCEPLIYEFKLKWRKRVNAARYRRVGTDTGEMPCAEEDVGFLEVVSSSFSNTPGVPCVVHAGPGLEKTCEVDVGELEKLSELCAPHALDRSPPCCAAHRAVCIDARCAGPFCSAKRAVTRATRL